jgi:hypothetical protein
VLLAITAGALLVITLPAVKRARTLLERAQQ